MPKKDTLVMTFGRMNPPTWGHEKVIDFVHNSSTHFACDYRIVISKTHDRFKNPLSFEDKLVYLKKAFPLTEFFSPNDKEVTIFHHLRRAYKDGYKKLYFVCGSDRKGHFNTMFRAYNGKEYKFDQIHVQAAAVRDDKTNNISGTAMRIYAANNDFEKFRAGLPVLLRNDLDTASKLFNDVRSA